MVMMHNGRRWKKGYVFFIIRDFILMRHDLKKEMKLKRRIRSSNDEKESKEEEVEELKKRIQKIKGDRVMRLMAVATDVADLFIAVVEIEPNPFYNHTITLGISGLVSTWAGWYRNWPS
ncbi:hypothetical protein PIB30_045605 [Stylosanthes scabra]|uniref:Uncharacterized protein n=1 Tax=Stylosanthes scabra TaxID=79078 RepID=A0ABU6SGS7_9FABA|nr:hypothetical protein [Stylosanthes scabra]